jgi:AcrR family transcriptional regulator
MPPPKPNRPRKSPKSFVFELKKTPTQPRAEATFEAIVTAAARLLGTKGYVRLTTNHVAAEAGVGIASVYEYFPGKDAIVARVAERLIDRVIRQLAAAVPAILAGPPHLMMRRWIDVIYETLLRERKLVAVFVEQVPYTRDLPAIRAITPRLLELSRSMQRHAGVTLEHETASLYLMINLVSSTILQLVLDPPTDITTEELLAALSHRVAMWIAAG